MAFGNSLLLGCSGTAAGWDLSLKILRTCDVSELWKVRTVEKMRKTGWDEKWWEGSGKGWEEMKRSEKRWDRLKRVEKSGEEVRRIEKRWEGWEDVTGVEKSWEGVTAVEKNFDELRRGQKRWGRIHKRVPNLWCSSSTPIGKCVLHSHSIAFLFAGDFRRASRGLYFYICKVTVIIIISSNINNSTNRNNNDINSYVIVFLSVLQIYLNCICMTMYLGWSNLWASISW